MKTKEETVRFIRWALPCMDEKNLYIFPHREKIILNIWPKMEKRVLEALKTGEIEQKILNLCWPTAMQGISKLANHSMLDYMFGEHNEKVKKLAQFDEKFWKCLARVGIFDGEKVVFPNGEAKKYKVADYLNLKKGDCVGVHLNKIVDVIDKNLYEECVKKMKLQGLL